MAGQIPYDFDAAQKAGMSDGQIVHYLSESGKVPGYDFNAALNNGVSPSQIIQMLGGTPGQSDLVDSAKEGVSAPIAGIGKTLETHIGKNAVSDVLEKGASAIAPPTYNAAPLYDQDGFHAGNIPAWLAANAPSMGVALAAAKATPGPWWAKVGGGALAGFLMNAGNEDQQAADNASGKAGTTPTWKDVARGDLTSAASNVVSSLPFTRYMPAATALDKVGVKGVGQALSRYLGTVGSQAVSSAAGNATEQLGQSIGTPSGPQVNPDQVANAGLGGALTGTYFGARPFARNALDAAAFGDLTNDPDLRTAATQVANQIQKNAGGENLVGGLVFNKNAQRAGQAALKKTTLAVNSNLTNSIDDVKNSVTLPSNVENILQSARDGNPPTPEDYSTLQDALNNSGYARTPQLMNAVRQVHALNVFNEMGHNVGNRLTGGIQGMTSHILTGENVGKSALIGAAAAAGEEAGHIIAYSPHVIGGAMALTGLAKLIDQITGAHTPAGRITQNFANPNVSTYFTPPVNPAPGGSGVPNIPLRPQPWGPTKPGLMPWQKARLVQQTMPLVRQLAKQQTATPTSPQASAPPMQPSFVSPTTAANVSPDALSSLVSKARADNGVMDLPASFSSMLSNPTAVTKANGKIGTQTGDEYTIPRSPYAALAPEEAAEKILTDFKAGGGVPRVNDQSFKQGVVRHINDVRGMVAKMAGVPGIDVAELSAQFEGAATQKEAIAHREWLKKQYPQASAALDAAFPDSLIKGTKLQRAVWVHK